MAHFAELDNDNKVLRIVLVDNKNTADADGNEVEAIGIAYLENLLGGNWIQTSYNGKMRGRYAGIGMKYDPIENLFYTPCEFKSWKLNTETAQFEAPKPLPTDGKNYVWNEEKVNWELVPDTVK
jgi:hypothetical protein